MSDHRQGHPRIAVLFPGDATDPTSRSGTPFGVLTGLRGWGVDVFPVDVRPSARFERAAAVALSPLHQRGVGGTALRARVRRGYSSALIGADLARLRSAAGQRRLDALGPLDGVVQLGAGYEVESPAPHVVYDDMTVAQALEYPYASWQSMRRRDVDARLAMQERVYRSATSCCMTSSWAARSTTDDYGVSAERVRVVGAGTHEPPRVVDRDWSTPRFLFVGLDFERKNGPRVLRAFARVRQAHPDARLDVVGVHPVIDQPGVVTHGRIPRDSEDGRQRLRGLFDAATCFVMPSLYEPAGVVFTEAAAAGLASIGGTRGGSADFIGDGGVVIDPTDDGGLVDAMLGFADPTRAAVIGAIASSRSPAFTWRALSGRLLGALGVQPSVPDVLPEDLPFRRPPA